MTDIKLIKKVKNVLTYSDELKFNKKGNFYIENFIESNLNRTVKKSDELKDRKNLIKCSWIREVIPYFPLLKRIADVVLKSVLFTKIEKNIIKCFFFEENIPIGFFAIDILELSTIIEKFRNFIRVYVWNYSIPKLYLKNKNKFMKDITLLFLFYGLVINALEVTNKYNSLVRKSYNKEEFFETFIKSFKSLNKLKTNYKHRLEYQLYCLFFPKQIILEIKKSHIKILVNTSKKIWSDLLIERSIGIWFIFLIYRNSRNKPARLVRILKKNQPVEKPKKEKRKIFLYF